MIIKRKGKIKIEVAIRKGVDFCDKPINDFYGTLVV